MDAQHIVSVGLEIVGAASVLAEFLRRILPYLRAWSEKTATNADNAAVEAAAIGLSLITMGIELVHKVAGAAAINPPAPKPKVVVEDSGSDDDEPKGDVFQ